MSSLRTVGVGSPVVFHDERAVPHNALVSIIWGPADDFPTLNLLYISPDESQRDQYGRQIIRKSSVQHASKNFAHGNYWRFADEEPNPVVPPTAS